MLRKTMATALVLCAGLGGSLAYVSTSAAAGGGGPRDPGPSGLANNGQYTAQITVVTTLGGSPTGGGGTSSTSTRTVPLMCWFENAGTAAEVLASYNNPQGAAGYDVRPHIDPVVAKAHVDAGDQGNYYAATCGWDINNGIPYDTYSAYSDAFGRDPANFDDRWVPAGTPPPAPPPLPPSVLLQYAQDAIKVPAPAVAHNPATLALVNVPTWIWSTGNTFAVATARASMGPNWAQVDATPTGMSISAPDAVQQPGSCATGGVPWAPGMAETATDCSLVFGHSSAGRAGETTPVTVQSVWTAAWTGSDGTGGVLPGATAATVVPIPVAEVQSILIPR